jgi:predicted O-methyltransferase YrrM
MKRFEIINHLIRTYGYKTYLEIGTQFGDCFQNIDIPHKVCVDPEKRYDGLTHEMTSDDFFAQNTETFDIVFVDGLHTEEQCTIDIHNAFKVLNPNGSIVVHDCLPHCEEFIKICWNGTVFRSIIDLRYKHPEIDIVVVDDDCGCGVLRRRTDGIAVPYSAVPIDLAKTYFYYENNKSDLMNVISPKRFLELHS